MKPVFADTVYFLALLNPTDHYHREARALSQQPRGPLLTTEFILTEVGDGLSRQENRPRFARLLQVLRSQADVEILQSEQRFVPARL
jgi:predicted nucleic acid-binding protein